MDYRGYNGTVRINGDALLLIREGAIARMGGHGVGIQRVPLPALSDVRIQAATPVVNGWISFGVGGAPAPDPSAVQAAGDPYVVLFRRKNGRAFYSLYEWLVTVVSYNRTQQRQMPSPPSSGTMAPAARAPYRPEHPTRPPATDPPSSPHEPITPPAAGSEVRKKKSTRRERALERDAFRELAIGAARGDRAALTSLPDALERTRAHWRRGQLESALRRAYVEAVEVVTADDILSIDEEEHLYVLADALGKSPTSLLARSPDAYDRLQVCRINDGRLPRLSSSPVLLKRDEVAYASFGVSLMKEVVRRETRGGGSGVSVPLGFGIRYRTGSYRGRSVVVGTELVAEDHGPLVVTSRRALFGGSKKTLEFRHDRLVGLQQYANGLRLNVSNRQSASLFRFARGDSPTIAAALIAHVVAETDA